MATKRIETQLTIKAVDHYSQKLKSMSAVTGRFASRIRTQLSQMQEMRGPLKLIGDFKKLQAESDRSRAAFDRQKAEVRRLREEMRKVERPTAKMQRDFESARNKSERLRQSHERHKRDLATLNGKLKEAGVNTANLGAEERRLARTVDRLSTSFGQQMQRLERMKVMQDRIATSRKQMSETLARGANMTFVGGAAINGGRRIFTALSSPIRAAVEFESAMSDVRKVVSFDSPQAFKTMSDDILKLSTRIPMAADGLAQIVAAGGQSGMQGDELLTFAEMAAKIGVAFDISAGQTGDAMASIKTQLGLSLDETSNLFDAMNHLSNNMASTAPKLVNFTTRVAADGEVKGFNATETIAFGSAMIAAGAQADVAATSFRNMGRALVAGFAATPAIRGGLANIGLEAEDVAKRMQQDAVGTVIDVFERINKLPEDMQSANMKLIFGDEARALTPLINRLDLLKESLGLVADEQNYLGSADREYAERAKTTANNMQLLRNQMTQMGVTIGEAVLPPLNDLIKRMKPIIEAVTDWAKQNKPLVKALLVGTAVVSGLAVAGGSLVMALGGLWGTLAVGRFMLSAFSAHAAFAAGDLTGLGRGIRGLSGTRLRLGLQTPSFGAALNGFSGFHHSAAGEISTLARHVDQKSLAMQRSLSRLKWKSFFGVGMMLTALSKIPTDPEERKKWQENNVRTMDSTLYNTPVIGHAMKGYEWAFEKVHGKPPPSAVASDDYRSGPPQRARIRTGLSEVTSPSRPVAREDRAALAAGERALQIASTGPLPTSAHLQELRDYAASLRDEIAGIQGEIDNFDQGPVADTMAMPLRQTMDARRRELQEVEEELSSAEGRAGELTAALQVLDGTEAAPEISTASIDRANKKVARLLSQLRAVPSAGTGATATPRPAGARAGGGPVRMGLPYLVNENTPRSEWFVPSRSGGVLNVGQAQAAFRSHLSGIAPRPVGRNPELARLHRGAQGLRAASLAVLTSSALAAPAAAQPAQAAKTGSGAVTVQIENFTVHVPSGVSDPEAIADLVSDRIGQRVAATMSASFSD